MKRVLPLATIILFIAFIASQFMTVVSIADNIKLTGIEAFGVQLGSVYFVETSSEYISWFFVSMASVWAVFLFVRYWRSHANKIVTILVSILAISSALYWVFTLNEGYNLKFGYYLWLISIIGLSLVNIVKKRALND